MSDTGWEDLKAMYAAEKKRREGIEDELYAERLAHASAVTRAELAERERDEARRNAHVVGVAMSNEVAARERAEADLGRVLDVLLHGTAGVKAETEAGGEVLRWANQALAEKDSLTARCARAEADNAALLEWVRTVGEEMVSAGSPCGDRDTQLANLRALLERMRALETAATNGAAELRHAYVPDIRDWNLVGRVIRMLEEATTPPPDALKVPVSECERTPCPGQ